MAADVARWLLEHPRAALALIGFCWLAGYAVACWWFPFGYCWCCKGKGVHKSKNGKHFRDCKRVCGGTGRRRRIGRTLYEAGRKIVRDGVG